ncbi:hypothetical protein B566_EDAN015756 [Ephemera danica]|nr:hypothetical protein B566_EDAN015756 [Ephemera danica]
MTRPTICTFKMFGWKKEEKKRPANAKRANLSQFGLMDIPDDFGNIGGMDEDDDDNDDDLEAELLALTTGSGAARPKRVKPPASANLDAMIAASMKDIPSDDDVSVDENDPELLVITAVSNGLDLQAELGDLVPEEAPLPPAPAASRSAATTPATGGQVPLLEQRLSMYQEAENNAKQAGDSARARRLSRGIKTLTDQLKQARAGRQIADVDIPPEVAVTPTRPSRVAPPPPVTPSGSQSSVPSPAPSAAPQRLIDDSDASQLAELLRRQLQFKQAALAAKKSGDNESALKYMRVSKMPELPMSAPIPEPKPAPAPQPLPQEAEVQGQGAPEAEPTPKAPNLPPELLSPPAPANVAESLAQRLIRYQAEERLAKEAGNSSKARRMGRICKQYQDAIKLHKAGKPIPVDELPTPPGYVPIPVPGAPAPTPVAAEEAEPVNDPPAQPVAPTRAPPPTPPKIAKIDGPSPATPPAVIQRTGSEVRKSPQSRQEKQTVQLLAKQKEFKEAALAAKRRGEMEQAREFLKQAKGFDALIAASNGGLPVDFTTLPVSPSAAEALESAGDFEYVTPDDCDPGGCGEIYDKLEEDLAKQIKLCIATRDHFKATGDVAGGNRFEQLAVRTQRDLLLVRACRKKGDPVPRFRYETKSFSLLQCCTDLGDNDLELNIIQGINYTDNPPKDKTALIRDTNNPQYKQTFMLSFVRSAKACQRIFKRHSIKLEDNPPKDKTALIRDTNNPQYKQTFMLSFVRSAKACQRIFKRHSIKLEVWSKGGFLRSDTLIGTVTVKLQPLETKCEIHDSFPVRVRVRNPLVTKQMEQHQERWLVLVEEA